MMETSNKKRAGVLVLTLAFAYTAVYGLPYLKEQFYAVELEALSLNNMQLGSLFSLYGIVAMIAYPIGGIIADRVSNKKTLLAALLFSGCLHFYVMTLPSYRSLQMVFAAMAVTSILLFYPISTRMLSLMGDSENRGSVFGSYSGLSYAIGIVVVLVGSLVFSLTSASRLAFRVLIFIYGMLHVAAAGMLWVFYREPEMSYAESSRTRHSMRELMKNPHIWMVAILVCVNYLATCCFTYVIPLLTDIYGISESAVLYISIIRVNVVVILASFLAGYFADRMGSVVGLIQLTCTATAVLTTGILVGCFVHLPVWMMVVFIIAVSLANAAGKSICFAMIAEIGVPEENRGSVIGVVSFLGYSPEAFVFILAGKVLDQWQPAGYIMIFAAVILTSMLGSFVGRRLQKTCR